MLINPVSQIMKTVLELLPEKQASSIAQSSTSGSGSSSLQLNQLLASKYDVNHMSLNELKNMIQELTASGNLSSDDTKALVAEESALDQLGGFSKDTKVDMVQLVQKQIEGMQSMDVSMQALAGMSNTQYATRTLDIINGIKASKGVKMPIAV